MRQSLVVEKIVKKEKSEGENKRRLQLINPQPRIETANRQPPTDNYFSIHPDSIVTLEVKSRLCEKSID